MGIGRADLTVYVGANGICPGVGWWGEEPPYHAPDAVIMTVIMTLIMKPNR